MSNIGISMVAAQVREGGPSGGGGGGGGGGVGGGGGGGGLTSSLPPSKRDKRRTLLSDRLNDLSVSFERDRDSHYVNQITALRQDYAAIASADTTGRDLRMLGDGAEDIDYVVSGGMYLGGDGAISNVRSGGPAGLGMQSGGYYAGFVQEVNEQMEERDVGLAVLHRQYHAKLTALKTQHERSLHHARQEHLHLAFTMKQRLINRLYNAKRKIAADKEQLDVADNHALLYHPNQFSIGSAAAGILSSPNRDNVSRGSGESGGLGDIFGNGGGMGSRRKLRQRKNEVDDLMLYDVFTGPGRGVGENNSNGDGKPQRRKARAARHSRRAGGAGDDEEDVDIYGNGVSSPSGNHGNGNAGVGAAQLASLLHRQQAGGAEHTFTKPVWAIEKLFTEKELQMAGNLAALATVKHFSERKEKKGGKGSKDGGTSGAETDDEDGTDGTGTPPTEDSGAVGLGSMDWANTPLAPTPSTAFGSTLTPVLGAGYHNTRSHTTITSHPTSSSRMLLNISTHNLLNSQPLPTLQQLSFMTPSGSGYGSAAWQALGIPATHFSAGSGSIINTTKALTLCAPPPNPAKQDDAEADLELIRSGVEVEVELEQVDADVEEVLTAMMARDDGWGTGLRGLKSRAANSRKNRESEKGVVGLGLMLDGENAEKVHEDTASTSMDDTVDSQATILATDVETEESQSGAIKPPAKYLSPIPPVSTPPRGHKRSATSGDNKHEKNKKARKEPDNTQETEEEEEGTGKH